MAVNSSVNNSNANWKHLKWISYWIWTWLGCLAPLLHLSYILLDRDQWLLARWFEGLMEINLQNNLSGSDTFFLIAHDNPECRHLSSARHREVRNWRKTQRLRERLSSSVVQYCICADPLMRLCVWVSSVLAFAVLILGQKDRNSSPVFIFLLLKMTQWELTFLCTSTTCQPEPSKVFLSFLMRERKTLNLLITEESCQPEQASKNAPNWLLNTSEPTPAHLAALLCFIEIFTSPWNKTPAEDDDMTVSQSDLRLLF